MRQHRREDRKRDGFEAGVKSERLTADSRSCWGQDREVWSSANQGPRRVDTAGPPSMILSPD